MDEEEEKKQEMIELNDTIKQLEQASKALLEERNKTSQYLKRIKQYENIISEKDESIQVHRKEKFELEEKLNSGSFKDKEKKSIPLNKLVTNLFKSESKNEDDLKKMLNEIQQLKLENFNLNKSINEENNMFKNQKIKFQETITNQTKEIKEANDKKNNLKDESDNLIKIKDDLIKKISDYEKEKKEYVDNYIKRKEEESKSQEQINQSKLTIEEKKKEIENKDNEIHKLNLELKKLYDSVNEKKAEINKVPLNKKDFQVEKIQNQKTKKMKISFNKNSKNNKYEITLNYEGKIDVIDILQTTNTQAEENLFELYVVYSDEKNETLIIKTDELLTEYFFKTYKEYYARAISDSK